MDRFPENHEQAGRAPFLSTLVIAAALLVSANAALATPDPDSQWWSELDLTHQMSSDLSFTASGYLRAGDGYPNPWLIGAGAAFDYRVSSFTLTGGDLWVRVRTLSGQSLDVQLPYVSGTYTLELGRFAFSDRIRAEQLSGLPGSPRRYRDRLGVNIPITGDPADRAALTLSREWLLDSAHQLTRTRTMLAVGFALSPATSVQLQYIRQHNTSGTPSALNVLGTELGVSF